MSALEFWKTYGSPVTEIITVVMFVGYLWLISKFPTRPEVEAVKSRLDGVEDSLALVRAAIGYLPDKASFDQMQVNMTEIRGDLKVLNERIRPLVYTTERLQEFLLEISKDKPIRARRQP